MLADIVREYRQAYEQTHILSPTERAALDAIERCRTAKLGGHVDVCLDCGGRRPSYNSCHNRHCPTCPAVPQARWIAGRLQRVLPVHYFHVVFTLPAELRGVANVNRELVYDLLFRCGSETLLEFGRDPKRIGGELGVTAVLHTWSRTLEYHPHLHCIVTGGALSLDGNRWIAARPNYLFPQEALAIVFRGKLLDALEQVQRTGKLRVSDPKRFASTVAALYRKDWNVYCKRPFGGPEQVIKYLGQYTHRVAISNQRLLAIDEHGVTFRTKSGKKVTVDGVTFVSRWCKHVLPRGYVKIRHFGLMSSSHATTRLEVARALLEAQLQGSSASLVTPNAPILVEKTLSRDAKWRDIILTLNGVDLGACPYCGSRNLACEPLSRGVAAPRAPPQAAAA
jgi:Putative transposase/Transposase zinc-binding domain